MPRPPCHKHIAFEPPCRYFKPAGVPLKDLEEVTLKAEEAEAIRLADCKGLYHKEAADEMKVSRQTFDRILKQARQKIACIITKGHALKIECEKDSE